MRFELNIIINELNNIFNAYLLYIKYNHTYLPGFLLYSSLLLYKVLYNRSAAVK